MFVDVISLLLLKRFDGICMHSSIHHSQAAVELCNPLEVHFTHDQLSIQSISIYHIFTHTITHPNIEQRRARAFNFVKFSKINTPFTLDAMCFLAPFGESVHAATNLNDDNLYSN